MWKQNKKNYGKEYVYTGNTVVSPRSSISCNCSKRCTDKFSPVAKEKILQDFNNLREKIFKMHICMGLFQKSQLEGIIDFFLN